MIEAILALIGEIPGYFVDRYLSGPSCIEYATLLFNGIMALTAVIAAVYGLKQYSQSVRVDEANLLMDIHRRSDEFVDRIERVEDVGRKISILLDATELHVAIYNRRVFKGECQKLLYDLIRNEIEQVDKITPLLQETLNRSKFPGQFDLVRRFIKNNNLKLKSWPTALIDTPQ